MGREHLQPCEKWLTSVHCRGRVGASPAARECGCLPAAGRSLGGAARSVGKLQGEALHPADGPHVEELKESG